MYFFILWQNDKSAKFPQAAFLNALSCWTGKNMSSYDILSQNTFARTVWEFQAKIDSAQARPECMASLIVQSARNDLQTQRCQLIMNRAIFKRFLKCY